MKKITTLMLLILATSIYAHQVTVKEGANNTFKPKFWAHGEFKSFEAKQLKGAKAYDINNKAIKTGIDFENLSILTAKKPAMVTLTFDAGYWVKGDNGYKNTNPTTYKGIVYDTLKSIKYGKRYFEYSDSFINPVGLKLEIVPLINPLEIKPNDKLPVLVIKDGKPAEGISFETSDYENLDIKTNEFGIASIPVKTSGLQIIAAVYYANQINDPKVNNITIQSSISFEVK